MGFIGEDNGIWTKSFDLHKWCGGLFPKGYSFDQPPDRFVELIFDANILKSEGYIPKQVLYSTDYIFDKRIPLSALVQTSKAYVAQALSLNFN